MKPKEIIPTHEFYDRLERSIPFDFIPLNEKSAYDPLHYHRHAYYEIFFFLKGGGKHDIDFDTFEVESGTLHFISPGQVHMLQRALDSNGFIILFSREFYQLGLQNVDTLYEMPFLNNNTSKPILKLPDDMLTHFKNTFEQMREENRSDHSDKEEVLRAQLNLLLLDSKRLFRKQNPDASNGAGGHSDLVKRLRIAIEKNFVHLHKPGEYAELLHISAGHLNDVVKEVLGMPCSDLIQERIILEAKRMLWHSAESVNEIATILNFEDPSYFARFFKNQTGLSPKDFREKIRERYR